MKEKRNYIIDKELAESFRYLYRMPSDFDPNAEYRKRIFGDRLLEAIHNAPLLNEDDDFSYAFPKPSSRVNSQAALARELHVSEMTISKYVNCGLPIPTDKLMHLYALLDATPHYLTGYTTDPHKVLSFLENGEPERKEDGSYVELYTPMTFHGLRAFDSFAVLSNIAFYYPEYFNTMIDFLNADDKTKALCFELLKAVMSQK